MNLIQRWSTLLMQAIRTLIYLWHMFSDKVWLAANEATIYNAFDYVGDLFSVTSRHSIRGWIWVLVKLQAYRANAHIHFISLDLHFFVSLFYSRNINSDSNSNRLKQLQAVLWAHVLFVKTLKRLNTLYRHCVWVRLQRKLNVTHETRWKIQQFFIKIILMHKCRKIWRHLSLILTNH